MWSHWCQLLSVVMARTAQTVSRGISLIKFPTAVTRTICIFTGLWSQITAPWWLSTPIRKIDTHAELLCWSIQGGTSAPAPSLASFTAAINALHPVFGAGSQRGLPLVFGLSCDPGDMEPYCCHCLRWEKHMHDAVIAVGLVSVWVMVSAGFPPRVCSALPTEWHFRHVHRKRLDHQSQRGVHWPLDGHTQGSAEHFSILVCFCFMYSNK